MGKDNEEDWMLTNNVCFSNSNGCVLWHGKQVVDTDEFSSYLCGPVRDRLIDQEGTQQYESDLNALATTGMAIDTLKELLLGEEQQREPWEIGEALAECLLEEEYGVKWPWNTERDKRTPKASLPGADLIGFIKVDGQMLLLVGEVKTSNDTSNPPNVMYGRSGMIHQLDQLASNLCVHHCLLYWLYFRCKHTDLWTSFQEAVKIYLQSRGRALALFGILLRDTTPNYLDLKNRAETLSRDLVVPTKAELYAWYFPAPISAWSSLVAGGDI